MRLFVAVNLPDGVRKRAWRASAPLREPGFPVKWVGEEGLHLTLRFLGSVERGGASEVSAALEGAARGSGPLDLRLGGVGAFPSLRDPRVLWLGVEGPPELTALREAVEGAMAALGFGHEEREFHPHVTLGRVRRGAQRGALEGLAAAAGRVRLDAACRIDSVELMESVTGPEGARYTVVSSHRL